MGKRQSMSNRVEMLGKMLVHTPIAIKSQKLIKIYYSEIWSQKNVGVVDQSFPKHLTTFRSRSIYIYLLDLREFQILAEIPCRLGIPPRIVEFRLKSTLS